MDFWVFLIIVIFGSIILKPLVKAIARRIEIENKAGLRALPEQELSKITLIETEVQSLREQVKTLDTELSSLKNEYKFLEALIQTDDTNKKQLSE